TKEVSQGEAGELCLRGPNLMDGYWKRPDETAAVLRDGWLYTGDIVRMDEDGYFYVVDRKKEMIIVSGFKVYPREVDEVLYAHPAVREVAAPRQGLQRNDHLVRRTRVVESRPRRAARPEEAEERVARGDGRSVQREDLGDRGQRPGPIDDLPIRSDDRDVWIERERRNVRADSDLTVDELVDTDLDGPGERSHECAVGIGYDDSDIASPARTKRAQREGRRLRQRRLGGRSRRPRG